MKKLVLMIVVGAALGGALFAQDDKGALGFGITTAQTSPNQLVSNSLRFNLFLDAGTKLFGPFFYGFELQGDVARLSQDNFSLTQQDVTAYNLGGGNWAYFSQTNTYNTTYTLWDLDLSPRGYISFEFGNKLQLLGFMGLNYNWQTLDYVVQQNGSDIYNTSTSFNGNWQAVTGFRVSLALFYLDYTRYINLTSSNLQVSQYNLDRFGLGISLRF